MPDMLVKLYELPEIAETMQKMKENSIEIRRAIAPEKHIVVKWVRSTFGAAWASECEVAFSNHPVSCYIAIENGNLFGFSCYDSTCRDFFGPIGVDKSARGKGTGTALMLKCFYDMEAQGYAYAVIGGAGPTEFYAKTVGAIAIEGSKPGIYRGILSSDD